MTNQSYRSTAMGRQDLRDNVLVCRLTLERCQQHLSHLHAILHLCLPERALDAGEDVAVNSMRKLIANMAQELSYGLDTLTLCD